MYTSMINIVSLCLTDLFFACRYANRVRNDKGCHLLLDRLNLLERNDDVRDPTEKIRVEADVVLRHVEAPVHENVFRQCTSVICCQ